VEDLQSIARVNENLRNALTLRLEKWRKFQRYISSQSRANFIYLLSERGFRGKLLVDHERKFLDLQVEPDKTEKRGAGRSTKTLSGGEKSFSSICLLLAIWEAMGSPLRCLDEFDVFMDNVNRAISTNMLITAARRSVNRQYIFITPNAIEGRTTLDKDVKIIRLTDPRQRTLADH
jgi:chromosome segregation ATPase